MSVLYVECVLPPRHPTPNNDEGPAGAGPSVRAAEGTRTLDLLHGKQTL